MLRQHAEDLNSGPLSKLSVLIRERQHLRKTYNEQWQQLQQELTKVGGHPEDAVAIRCSFTQECLGKQKSLTAGPAPGWPVWPCRCSFLLSSHNFG